MQSEVSYEDQYSWNCLQFHDAQMAACSALLCSAERDGGLLLVPSRHNVVVLRPLIRLQFRRAEAVESVSKR